MTARKIAVDALVALGLFALLLQAWTLFQAERIFKAGEQLEEVGLDEQATLIYKRALLFTPDRFEIQRALGRACLKTYQPGSRNLRPLFMAQAALFSATELNPLYPYGWQELGEVYFRLRQAQAPDVPNPGKYFSQALAIDPVNPRFLASLMRWELASGQRTRAWETFTRLIDSDPAAIRAYGDLLVPEKDDVDRLQREIQGNIDQTVQLARLIYGRKDFVRAEEMLRQLPPEQQLEPEAASLLAAALRQQKRMDEAEKALANSIARNPENLYLVRDLGWLFVAEKKNQPALELFDREVSSHPDQLWLCLEAAKAATALGEYERAAGWYDTALVSGRLNEKQTRNALLGLAEARRRQGKIRPALIAYERLLETEPDNRAFRQMAKELQLELDRQE